MGRNVMLWFINGKHGEKWATMNKSKQPNVTHKIGLQLLKQVNDESTAVVTQERSSKSFAQKF
jgi:hypothetical protein